MAFLILLAVVSGLTTLVAAIWLIVIAFKNKDTLWGAGMIVGLFVPIIGLVATVWYAIVRWQQCSTAAITYFAGNILAVIAAGLLITKGVSEIQNSPEMQAAMTQAAEARNNTARPPANAPEAAPETAPPPPQTPAPKPAPKPAAPAKPAPARATPSPATPKPIEPTPRPPAIDPNAIPIAVSMLSISEAGPNQLRTIRVQLANPGPQPVREIKLDLAYLSASGERIGGWTTVHSGTGNLAEARSTNSFSMTAFFVPRFTEKVRLGVASIVYADGSRWP